MMFAALLLAVQEPPREVTVRATGSTYKVAPGKTSGAFKTGRAADLALSAIGFNDAGGPLMFNHPIGIASDGTRLLLADTYNNRVLIWSKLPEKNDPPDLVLGQKDFTGNDSGDGRDRLNWPVAVATDGKRVIVADTENERLLIWTSFPTKSGQAADLAIQGGGHGLEVSKTRFFWPWGVWTNGEKLALTSTRGGGVLIWNAFPTKDDQPADLVLKGGGHLGTPRQITSDGKALIIGDHNPRAPGAKHSGTYFWKAFPTRDDAPYDFFREGRGTWLRGSFLPDGKVALLAETLFVWNAFPADAKDEPDVAIRDFSFRGGDHVTSVLAGGRFYICTGNLNKIVVYNAVPTRADQKPDFAIGAPDLATNTLDTKFIMSNPVPVSDGKSLFVASDFDRRLYVYTSLPDESGAAPDFVYEGLDGPWGAALWKESLALAGHRTVYLWTKLPLKGEMPDVTLRHRLFKDVRGVAMDDGFFYVSDVEANKVYVWKGVPGERDEPAATLAFDHPARLSSDGTWLAVCPMMGHQVHLYRVGEWGKHEVVGGVGKYNGLPSAQVRDGRLFMADGGFSRVHVWNRVEDAIAGKRADALLGASSFDEKKPECARDKLHYPAAVWYDGAYLWVGETKFSERLLRFSPGT